MVLETGKKVYFLSDFHLGAPNDTESRKREDRLVRFLQDARKDAGIIFIVGDIFDFWFEYKTVVPKGFVRILGTLAQLADEGIQLHIFTGNHDLWMQDYLSKELNAKLYFEPQAFTIQNKQFLIGHGDGLGPGDKGYKRLKKIFTNPICQWLFRWLHPDAGIQLANYFSRKSRAKTGNADEIFLGEDKEWLILYTKEKAKTMSVDFFIFGHRHYAIDLKINDKSRYINLGDWIRLNTYAVFDGTDLQLLTWEA
ncbi:MAG: UDP-2,3-diacylglucosamine diphosphatase [Chitinophagaceae bacterium]|jgi:UDP-2,3-diacylglucosamine hydrolase|nr:UDP-2,3-diacylglucosamine diphosphatase [Chitinophagaceae bacterium]MCF8289711.1 UDP-2,3-diacylglucosamine diphosphatase [Chitinophagaceae bacterium]MCF8421439.1 UDP-2,3-diacylglucosamine diphosphatase [Chitinophagaceae bacterium]